MKRIILTGFIALSLLFTTTSCDNDDDHETVITATDLPQTANTFVTTYFPNANYQVVKNKADQILMDLYMMFI